jgi:hypothetical protein
MSLIGKVNIIYTDKQGNRIAIEQEITQPIPEYQGNIIIISM